MRREAFGLVKAQHPSVGESQDREVEVGGLLRKRRESGIEGFSVISLSLRLTKTSAVLLEEACQMDSFTLISGKTQF